MEENELSLCKEAVIYISDVITELTNKIIIQDNELKNATEKINELNEKVQHLIQINNTKVTENQIENIQPTKKQPIKIIENKNTEIKNKIINKNENINRTRQRRTIF
jgi:hypothetical protein